MPDYRIIFAGPSAFKVEITSDRYVQVIGRFPSEAAARVWVAEREARDAEAALRQGRPLGSLEAPQQ
jgi:hypothetical protein